MNQDRSLKFMGSMMNALENMGTLMFGNTLLISLTLYQLQQLLKIKFSVFTEASLPALTLSNKSNN